MSSVGSYNCRDAHGCFSGEHLLRYLRALPTIRVHLKLDGRTLDIVHSLILLLSRLMNPPPTPHTHTPLPFLHAMVKSPMHANSVYSAYICLKQQ